MSLQYLPVLYQRASARALLSQEHFARRCGMHPDLVRRLVALGLVHAERDEDGALCFSPSEVAAVARLQRLRTMLPLNYAALGLVVELLDRITELETALRVRGRTEPVRPRTATRQPTPSDQERSTRWT
jgi:chaperone modulatory protein CbpM